METPHLPMDVAAVLLGSVARIADDHAEIAGRRKAMIKALADAIGADSGLWAWGRGWPDSSAVVPVAQIDVGFDDHHRTIIMDMGLDAELDREFRGRIRRQMGPSTHVTSITSDIFTPEEWAAEPFMRRMLRRAGWTSWLHSVRYGARDTWSNLLLLRNEGRPDFGPPEAAVAHLVLAVVPWLHSTVEESLPAEVLIGLTPRQRTVMLMMLDGLSRKAIASRLDISSDTVGDHIKAIYAQFGVGTSGQLAALFLRNR